MIVAGFGFRAGATVAALQEALELAAKGRHVAALATVADKAGSGAFTALAGALHLPVIAVEQRELEQVATMTQSQAARAARGTGSVAEASALAAAGPGAVPLGARVVSGDRTATCALAKGPGR